MYTESTGQEKTRLNNFIHHPPKESQAERYTALRAACGELSRYLNTSCPPSRELSLAQTKLEEVMFWGNAAIARNE